MNKDAIVEITTFNAHIELRCYGGLYQAAIPAYNAISVEMAWQTMMGVWEGDDIDSVDRRCEFFRSLPKSILDIVVRVMAADCNGAIDAGINNDELMDVIRRNRTMTDEELTRQQHTLCKGCKYSVYHCRCQQPLN